MLVFQKSYEKRNFELPLSQMPLQEPVNNYDLLKK